MHIIELPRREIDRFESVGAVMDFLPDVVTEGPGRTSVHLLNLAAGGTLGRHRATRRQQLAVVAGTARVSVDDDPAISVGPGCVVVWEPGETHQTWSDDGALVVVVETDGTVEPSRHHVVRVA